MIRNRVIALTLTAALGVSVVLTPAAAFADTSDELQAQLDAANAQLNEYYAQAEEASEKVSKTQEQLDQTNADIEAKEVELDAAKDILADRVTSDYKSGGVNILQVGMGSTSLADFISRYYLATKVAESDAKTIQNVKDIQAELDAKKSEQEELLSTQKAEQEELDAKAAEAEAYISSLSSELQAAIAEEQAAAQAAAEAAAAAAEAEATANNGNYVTEETTTDNSANTSSDTTNSTTDSGSYSGSLTQAQRNAIVSAAWAQVGKPYVYGGNGPDSFDCSGFTCWCYSAAGISLPRSSYSQGGCGSSTSNPQAGDIVCWGGHVGIYMGGGMMIDAGNPRVGVSYRSVYGSPWYRTF